jgi:hypothetical protein
MRPLRVTCLLSQPVIYQHDGMNLDGILSAGAWAAMSRKERETYPSIQAEWVEDMRLPVDRWYTDAPVDVDDRLLDGGRLWGWCTSDVQARWVGRDRHALRKKTDTTAMQRWTDGAQVDIGAGEYKGKNMDYETQWPDGGLLTWYCRGERDEVLRLLRHVPYLGRLGAHGLGKIEADLDGTPCWRVDETDDDWWHLRSLPATHRLAMGHPKRMACRAPRHHRSRYVDSLAPPSSR